MCSFTANVRKLRVLVGGALLFTLMTSATIASAQSDRGTVQGIVKDPTGAVVPGAQVEIRHLATNTVTTITTNDVGLFTAPNLPLGDYLLLVTKAGFGSATADGINPLASAATSLVGGAGAVASTWYRQKKTGT